MPEDKKITKAVEFSPEIKNVPEKVVEQSFDSNKIEQVKETESQSHEGENANATPLNMTLVDNVSESAHSQAEGVHQEVENILTENMDNIYLSLDAGTQKVFKLKGEETAQKITQLLMRAKVKFKEVSQLILEWLRIIPRVNKHYIEQEAKIKTDKILKIKNE